MLLVYVYCFVLYFIYISLSINIFAISSHIVIQKYLKPQINIISYFKNICNKMSDIRIESHQIYEKDKIRSNRGGEQNLSKSNIQSVKSKDETKSNKSITGKEVTVRCWNCDTDMIIDPNWRIIQCIKCSKLNRVPGSGIFDHEVGKITYKDQKSDTEFDIKFPVTVSNIPNL